MSDDFDDLPDDDLFTNPASLAAIEQAVASAEQHARTQGGNPSGNAGMQNRAGAVGGSHKYHHAMAPAGSLLRGRGAHHQTNAQVNGNKLPAHQPGMGMRPRPAGASTTATSTRTTIPEPQIRHTSPAVHHLSRDPVPVQAAEDDEEYGPEFSVDDYGNYFASEVKDVRRQGLEDSVLADDAAAATGAAGKLNVASTTTQGAVQRLGERKGLSRSTSLGTAVGTGMNASHTPSHLRPNAPIVAPHPATTNNPRLTTTGRPPSQGQRFPNNHSGKPFQRVNSDGENARRQAIQSVLSASQTAATGGGYARPPMSQGITRPLTGSQLYAAGQNSVPLVGASGGAMMGKSVGNSSRGGAERPSVVAGVTDKDIQELKQQVAQMAKEKKEIEERANTAMQDLWRYQGEVKNVRLKADEEKKHAENKFTDLQKQLADLEEVLKSERLGHRRALDTVQTDHAFKMHNEQSSHVKARFGTTQRTRTAQQMQSTPSRPNRDGVSASQQGGASQFPVDVNYAYTPSRSPTKKGAATTGRTRIGSMGPPPVPDLNAGFMTPKPLTTSSRKARVSDGKKMDRNTPTNPKFTGLQDTFAGDTQIPSHKKRKTRMDTDEGGRGSPTPSVFEEGDHGTPEFDMHVETYQTAEEEDQDAYMDFVQDDIIVEVNHIIFTHSYTPIWESPSESMKTVQRILTSHSNTGQDAFPLYQQRCSSFLEACGNREATPLDFCHDVNHALWGLLNTMIDEEESVAPAKLVSLMQLLTLLRVRVPQYASVFTSAAMDMPRNMFLNLISQYWDQSEPATVGGMSATPIAKRGLDSEGQFTLPWAHKLGIGHALCAMLSGVHSMDGEAPACYAAFASAPEGIRALLSVKSPISVVVDALDLLSVMTCDPELFRPLLSVKAERNSQEAADVKRPPLVDSLCGYLKQDHPDASVTTGSTICQRVLSIVCNLCQVHTDGLTLLGNSLHLVPSLVQLAETRANQIWGICARDEEIELHFGVLVAVVTVLHMMIFPPEAASQNTPSVHLRSVIARALESPKEYNGLHHVFITALGRISYAPVPDMKKWSRLQVTTLRYLAQDLLSELVGGNQREDDAIYAMYVFSENEDVAQEAERIAEEGLDREEGPNAEEEAESKAMMEIIEIDD